jgi:hypothetical protein
MKLQTGDDTPGPHDANELAQGRRGIVDVAEEVRERERVEGSFGKRKLLGAALA